MAHTEPTGWPRRVRVVEVGTRDGFQAEPSVVPTADKIRTIDRLVAAGVREFEATSFVSPKAVPQLADAARVMQGVARRPGVRFTALVPNLRGAEAATAARVDAMVLFLSASESHNRKNVNRTVAQSLDGFVPIARLAAAAGIEVQGAIATAFGCPFEGDVATDAVVRLAEAYRELGIRHVTLGDTTGMATPPLVADRCTALRRALPDVELALHFHNTRGIGLVNVYAGLQAGIDVYESSIGGLGGCPFAPGATGNVATEDLVYLLHECGIETGIDLDALLAVAREVERTVGHELPGQVMKAGPRLALRKLDEVATAAG